MRTFPAIAILSFGLVTSSSGDDRSYTIQFDRPYQVGYKREISVVSNKNHAMAHRINGKLQPPRPGLGGKKELRLSGVEEVLKVGADGSIKRSQLVIGLLTTQTEDDAPSALMEPGTNIDINQDDNKTVFSIGGKPLVREKSETFSRLLQASWPGSGAGAGVDRSYGTTEKQRVGQKWKIDTSEINAEMADKSGAVSSGDYSGWMMIQSVVERGGIKYLDIYGEISIKNMIPPIPRGLSLDSTEGKIILKRLVPVDHALHTIESSSEVTHQIDASGKGNGMTVELSNTGKATFVARYKAVEEAE